MGNDLADRAAKQINKLDTPLLLTATETVFDHSQRQQHVLSTVYRYLAELNALHSKLNLEKEQNAAETHEFNTLDAVSNYQNTLRTWRVSNVGWILRCDLPEVVAQACPCGASIAFKVWRMFHTFDSPATPGDFGISWYELAFYFAIFTGHFLPIWISSKTEKLPLPYDFDSPEAQIQPQEKRSLWHQASVLRSVVRYLENTLQCEFYPRYKKTNASSLIRLGYHRSLVGGISARPNLPFADLLIANLTSYSSMPNQSYPLNVRMLPKLKAADELCPNPPYSDITYRKRHNLYQKLKKCLRLKHNLADIDVPN